MCLCLCACVPERVVVGCIPSVLCCVHTRGEIRISASQGYGLATERTHVAAVADMNGENKSFWESMT